MPKLILYSLFFLEFIVAILIASAFPLVAEVQFFLAFLVWLCLSNWTHSAWKGLGYVQHR